MMKALKNLIFLCGNIHVTLDLVASFGLLSYLTFVSREAMDITSLVEPGVGICQGYLEQLTMRSHCSPHWGSTLNTRGRSTGQTRDREQLPTIAVGKSSTTKSGVFSALRSPDASLPPAEHSNSAALHAAARRTFSLRSYNCHNMTGGLPATYMVANLFLSRSLCHGL